MSTPSVPCRPILALALALPLSSLSAQEWTRFRGPAGQGIGTAADLPAAFTPANVLFSVDLGGKGHSSPVLWGERVFLTRDPRPAAVDAEGRPIKGAAGKAPVGAGSRQLVCLDANTGAEQWATDCDFERHRQHGFNSFASSTAAVDADGVYLVWSSGGKLIAEAFDHRGKRSWHRELGAFRAQHGSGASPVLFGDLVVVANENEGDESFLTALDRRTGEPRWRIPRKSHPKCGAYSCPIVHRPGQGDPYLLFTSTSHGLTAVDPAAGKVLWETELDLKFRCVNGPAVCGDLVFFSGGSGGGGKESAIVRLPARSGGKPEVVQQVRKVIPYVPCALALGDRFYLVTDGGVARSVVAPTGEEVWRARLEGAFFSSPVSNGKTIYVVSRAGVLISFAAADEFRELGRFDLGDQAFATPAIAFGRLYVRTFGKLVCLGAAKPRRGV